MGVMGELPDQEIYGLLLAKNPAVTQGAGVGRRYLTARTSHRRAMGTQRGPSNSVRARYELLRADAGPAAAAVLSPGSLTPPTYKKMTNTVQTAERYDMKSAVGTNFYAKSAEEKNAKYMKSAVGMVYEFATFAVEGMDKTNRKKGASATSTLCPPRCPDGSCGGDIVGVPVVFASHVVRNLPRGDGQPDSDRSVVAEWCLG